MIKPWYILFLWALVLQSGIAHAENMQGNAANPINSLIGRYFLGQNFERLVMTRQDATIDFDWGDASISEHLRVSDHFSVRWQGYIMAPEKGRYTIHVRADAGIRLWIGTQKMIDTWGGSDVEWHTGDITLSAGKWHPIRLDYREDDGEAFVSLHWSRAETGVKSVIASQYLSSVRQVSQR